LEPPSLAVPSHFAVVFVANSGRPAPAFLFWKELLKQYFKKCRPRKLDIAKYRPARWLLVKMGEN
jgi:hypothetical protein